MGKGDRREKELQAIYERAGYDTYRPATVRFGENDVWGLFDVLAYNEDIPELRLVQVKSNQARGIRDWVDKAAKYDRLLQAVVDFAIIHDHEGWRLFEVTHSGYSKVVDERKTENKIGKDLEDYLKP